MFILVSRTRIFEYINKYGLHNRTRLGTQISEKLAHYQWLKRYSCTALQQLNHTKTHTISPTFQGNTKVIPRHTDRYWVEMFHNYSFKEWISLKFMLLWLCKVIMSLLMHVE